MPEYKLPDVGEGLTEAEVVAWRVKVGDVIEVNEIVCDIETAKSIVELPSPYAGEVTALLVPEGETVAVGTPIIRIGADSAVEEVAQQPSRNPGATHVLAGEYGRGGKSTRLACLTIEEGQPVGDLEPLGEGPAGMQGVTTYADGLVVSTSAGPWTRGDLHLAAGRSTRGVDELVVESGEVIADPRVHVDLAYAGELPRLA